MAWGARGGSAVNDLVQRIAGNDPRLTELHIMLMRKLDEDAVKALCTAFKVNTVCTTLYASGHRMSPTSAAVVADMLAVNRALSSLCVGDSSFGDDALSCLGRGLGADCCLVTLDMENKGLSHVGLQQLMEILGANTILRKLVLNRNAFSAKGWSALCKSKLNLRHLELQSCGLSGEGLQECAADMPSWPHLESLHLGNNDLSAAVGPHLAAFLSSCTALRSLSLERCVIGDSAVAALAPALEHLPALQHLDLSQCAISPIGAKALADGFSASTQSPRAPPLTSLVLSGNPLDAAGVTALADGLAALPSLSTLELGECGVTVPAFQGLWKLTQLRSLNVFGNRMGDDVLGAVMDAVESANRVEAGSEGAMLCGLHFLGLSGNALGCDALTAFMTRLQKLPNGAVNWREVEVGANPGCEEDSFEAAVTACREAQPSISIVWRATDIQSSRIIPKFPGGEDEH